MSENKHMRKLNSEEMEKVSGGYVYCDRTAPSGQTWVVVDNKGNFQKRYETMLEAVSASKNSGFDGGFLDDDELQELRETGTVIR